MPPESMVESWPVLPVGDTSESVALQQQGFATTKGQTDIPVYIATWEHVDVQGLYRGGPVSHPSMAPALPAPRLALVAWVLENWQANQPGYHPGPDPGL